MTDFPAEIVERRTSVLNGYVEGFNTKVVEKGKTLDLAVHRFIAVERETVTSDYYMSGHKTARAACEALAREVEGCGGWSPMFLLDLDADERHIFKIVTFVFPENVDGIGIMLPRELAETLVSALSGDSEGVTASAAIVKAAAVIQRAIDRR